jgi:hypothetical protein
MNFQVWFFSLIIAFVTAEIEKDLDFYDLKCSACCSMVAELERNLETEKPKMNVDLRRTLSGSADNGKTIDYSVSELRTYDLLEQLCPGMRNYGIAHQEDGTATFQRYNVDGGSIRIGGSLTIGGDKHRVDQTRLESYCYALVEEHEEMLAEVIRSAGLAKKAREDEKKRLSKLKRKKLKQNNNENNNNDESNDNNDEDDDINLYEILGIEKNNDDMNENLNQVKKAYRKLSKIYHPDKNNNDVESVKKFVSISNAYELITGDEVTPYGNIYRELCLDMANVCLNEEEIDKQKYYFPRYANSEKFGNSSGGGLSDNYDDDKKKDKKKKKKKSKKKKNISTSDL